MRCEEIAHRPVLRVRPEDSVLRAACLMRDANIGFLPVCDERDRVVGVLTDRDLAMRVLAEERGSDTRVRDVMSGEVVACGPQDDLRQAQRLMARHRKSRLVLLGPQGKLEGVVSLADVAEQESILAADTLSRVASREAAPPRRKERE